MYAAFSHPTGLLIFFSIFQVTSTMLGTRDTTVKRHGIFFLQDVYRSLAGREAIFMNQSEIKEESISKSLWASQRGFPEKVAFGTSFGS